MKQTFATVLLGATLFLAFFGMFIPLASHDHSTPCPLSSLHGSLCTAPLSHISFWQESLAVTLSLLYVFIFALVLVSVSHRLFENDVGVRLAVTAKSTENRSPFRLKELYADGILNRKEPSSHDVSLY
jgi:hypothetical protein